MWLGQRIQGCQYGRQQWNFLHHWRPCSSKWVWTLCRGQNLTEHQSMEMPIVVQDWRDHLLNRFGNLNSESLLERFTINTWKLKPLRSPTMKRTTQWKGQLFNFLYKSEWNLFPRELCFFPRTSTSVEIIFLRVWELLLSAMGNYDRVFSLLCFSF